MRRKLLQPCALALWLLMTLQNTSYFRVISIKHEFCEDEGQFALVIDFNANTKDFADKIDVFLVESGTYKNIQLKQVDKAEDGSLLGVRVNKSDLREGTGYYWHFARAEGDAKNRKSEGEKSEGSKGESSKGESSKGEATKNGEKTPPMKAAQYQVEWKYDGKMLIPFFIPHLDPMASMFYNFMVGIAAFAALTVIMVFIVLNDKQFLAMYAQSQDAAAGESSPSRD